MALLKLCDGDPIVKTLMEVFNASIVRVPETRVQPMSVVAAKDSKSSFRGRLAPLLLEDDVLEVPEAKSQMTNIKGKRTKSVKTDVGLKILEGFLTGFGLPGATIGAQFAGASEVTFAFNDVVRTFVDTGVLGRQLIGKHVNKENPAAAIFFGEDSYEFLVLDSVIGSSDFTIAVSKSNDKAFKLDLPAIQNVVKEANVGVSVSTTTNYDLTFKGPEHLTFAFSAVRFHLTKDGTVDAMPPGGSIHSLSKVPVHKEKEDSAGEAPGYLIKSSTQTLVEFH